MSVNKAEMTPATQAIFIRLKASLDFMRRDEPNRYAAERGFGLIRESQLAGFGLCGCGRPRCAETAFHQFGLCREGGFVTWHGAPVKAPQLER